MTLSIPQMTAEDARHLTDRIKIAVEGTWQLITEAYTSRAYIALGYRNWDDYCTREFGTARLRLPREERSEVVASLRESGLSIRAIAAATGTGTRQVQESIREVWSETTPQPEPDPEPVLTQEECEALAECEQVISDYLDQDTEYCDCGDGLCECLAGECSCGIVPELPEVDRPEADPPVPEKRITGTDGKSYPTPAKKPPNRRALPDAARDAGWELRKAVEKLERLFDDDRFSRNRDEVATQIRSHLTYAIDSCQGFIDRLPLP